MVVAVDLRFVRFLVLVQSFVVTMSFADDIVLIVCCSIAGVFLFFSGRWVIRNLNLDVNYNNESQIELRFGLCVEL